MAPILPTVASVHKHRQCWKLAGGRGVSKNGRAACDNVSRLDNETAGSGQRSCRFVGGPGSVLFDIKETKSVFKVGLNFLFNAGAGPVTARY